MVALLLNCSAVDQRDVILFFFCDQKKLKHLKLITERQRNMANMARTRKMFFRSTTTCVHVIWQLLFKQSGSSNLNFSHISHIFQT